MKTIILLISILLSIVIYSESNEREPLDFPLWDLGKLNLSAPEDYLSASKENFPIWKKYQALEESRFTKLPPGVYAIQESLLSIWDNGIFQWKLPDGTILDSRLYGYKSIEKDGYKFEKLGENCKECLGKNYLYYPDGSRLERYRHPVSGRIEFTHHSMKDDGIHHFTLYEPGFWTPRFENYENLMIHFSNEWKTYLETFKSRKEYYQFLKLIENQLGMKNPGTIPVILIDSEKRFQKLLNTKNSNTKGGHGGIAGIKICCGKSLKKQTESSLNDFLFSNSNHHYLLLHELTHNFQQHRCMTIKRSNLKGLLPSPPTWFNEGIAVFVPLQIDKQLKERFLLEFQNYSRQTNNKKELKSYQYGSMEVYIAGGLVLEFIHRKYGIQKIRDLNENFCSGLDEEETFQNVFQKESVEIFHDAIQYFRDN